MGGIIMGRSTFKRSILSASVLSAVTAAAILTTGVSARAATSPDEFVGSYRLLDTVVGSCLPEIVVSTYSVDPSANDMRVGPFFFPKVNGGAWDYEDSFVKGRSIAWTTDSGQLILNDSYFDKFRELPGTRHYTVTLSDEATLRVRAELRGFVDVTSECLYERFESLPEEP